MAVTRGIGLPMLRQLIHPQDATNLFGTAGLSQESWFVDYSQWLLVCLAQRRDWELNYEMSEVSF